MAKLVDEFAKRAEDKLKGGAQTTTNAAKKAALAVGDKFKFTDDFERRIRQFKKELLNEAGVMTAKEKLVREKDIDQLFDSVGVTKNWSATRQNDFLWVLYNIFESTPIHEFDTDLKNVIQNQEIRARFLWKMSELLPDEKRNNVIGALIGQDMVAYITGYHLRPVGKSDKTLDLRAEIERMAKESEVRRNKRQYYLKPESKFGSGVPVEKISEALALIKEEYKMNIRER